MAIITSDETLVIETPERVPLHFALASIGNRFIACAIDHTIQIVGLITIVIIFLVISDAADLGARLNSAPKWVIALLVIMQFVIINGYFAIFAKQLKTARPRTPSPNWPKIDAALSTAVASAIKGQTTTQQALNDAAKQIDGLLAA